MSNVLQVFATVLSFVLVVSQCEGKLQKSREQLKLELLKSISRARQVGGVEARDAIVANVERLEQAQLPKAVDLKNLDGKWSLIYSTRAGQASSPSSLVDSISARLYRLFFTFLPALAGSSGAEEAASSAAVNIQEIDLEAGTVINTVTLRRLPIRIEVNGECTPSGSGSDTVDVVFTSCLINSVAIPLPRPKGSLRTTYLDASFRISRGGQGGVFIVKRVSN